MNALLLLGVVVGNADWERQVGFRSPKVNLSSYWARPKAAHEESGGPHCSYFLAQK